MEFDFKASLNETRDIDLFGFDKIVDKNFDYLNDIEIDIKWRAVMYMKDYGITDNWPIIDEISLDMNYVQLEPEERVLSEDYGIDGEEKKLQTHLK